MQYLLLIYSEEATLGRMSEGERGQVVAAFNAYTTALKESGVYVGSNRLKPIANATSVRLRNGAKQVQDGPFAETKEQLGGYYLIEVPDLDDAIAWAARLPSAAFGTIEVRPIWQM